MSTVEPARGGPPAVRQPSWAVAALALILLLGLAAALAMGEPGRFAPALAIVVLVVSSAATGRLRTTVNGGALAVWLAVLLWDRVGTSELLLHLAGGALVVVAAASIADALVAARQGTAEVRDEAEGRASLLAALLRTDVLDPEAVLRETVSGLVDAGFDLVVIRLIDAADGSARRFHEYSFGGHLLAEVVPAGRGLVGRAVRERRTVVVDDLEEEPDAVDRGLGIAGVVIIPLLVDGEVAAVLSGASMRGPLDVAQLQAAERLGAQAEGALGRARAFAADRRTVAELRRLDIQTHDFVSTVSHELRTPLTVISGLGETLRARWDGLPPQQRGQLLHRIDANAERLAVMVRSLLDTSAFEEGELEFEPRAVVVRDAVEALLDRLATITVEHPVELLIPARLEVEVDPGLFEHVLENLLINVAKHTPPGTAVGISAVARAEKVQIAVTDRGPGIAAVDLPHVLDRFYRGGEPDRRASGGLGLGLALARQIVEVHGSELRVDSVEGEGTRFSFEVPAVV